MKNALFIASLDESYYFFPFIKACNAIGISVYILDPNAFPDRTKMCLSLDGGGKISGFIDVFEYVDNDTRVVSLPISNIHIAWYIRDGYNRKVSVDNSVRERFIRNESFMALHSFYSVLECKWINKKETIDLVNSNKFFQQSVARRSGLSIPDTVIGNDTRSIFSMSSIHNGLLAKTIGYVRLDDQGNDFLYSEIFSHEEILGSAESINACPVFCQQYIEKKFEYRVYAIGDDVLSCRIDSQASEVAKIDWRHYDFQNVEHLRVDLPADVNEKILRFMKNIGLRYGAIDLIETPSGDFVFLEINPSGQWGWIYNFTKLPIAESVAKMLQTI